MKPRVFYHTIFLDQKFSRSMRGGNHWIGSTIKAWKVVGTNNENFKLRIVPDPVNSSVEGFEMEDTPVHNLTEIANEAVLENDVVQAGVFVRIMFTVEDALIFAGDKNSAGNVVVVSEGSNHSSSRVDVPNDTITVLVNADDKRAVSNIQLKSGGTFWVGNPSELADVDYKNICQSVTLSVGEVLQYKNVASLSCRTDSGALVFSVFKEVF